MAFELLVHIFKKFQILCAFDLMISQLIGNIEYLELRILYKYSCTYGSELRVHIFQHIIFNYKYTLMLQTSSLEFTLYKFNLRYFLFLINGF